MDLVRACAELGVTPSASLREAKRAYKRLVKRWHPDRFASDVQAQAEATLRLQRITEAYQVIAHALGPGAAVASALGRDGARYERGERLPREEVERLVRSLGNEGPLDALLQQPVWWWPLPFGVVFLLSTRSIDYEWLFAGGILLIAVTPLLWWLDRRDRRGRGPGATSGPAVPPGGTGDARERGGRASMG
jgi:DnaJ domain